MPRTSATWRTGVSGNPNGRPLGAKDRRTLHRGHLAAPVAELVPLLLGAARTPLEQAMPWTRAGAEVVPVDPGEGR